MFLLEEALEKVKHNPKELKHPQEKSKEKLANKKKGPIHISN